MTPKEMIEVIAAFERGEKIEYHWHRQGGWAVTNTPEWDFSSRDYRVLPPKPKMVKYFGYIDQNGFIRLVQEFHAISMNPALASKIIRAPNFDCELPE